MQEFLQYIQTRHEDSREHIDAASELLEYLYFMHIKPVLKTLGSSEEYRIAQDLLRLKKALKGDELEAAKLRTAFVKQLLAQYGIAGSLTKESREIVENNIIREYRFFITAAFIADIVKRQTRQEQLRWVITALLGLLATLASYGWLFRPTS